MTGMPSGRGRPPAFGIYTRLTGLGFHDSARCCTRLANSAFTWGSSAVLPSIPAVLRPVLTSATRRTLSSVLARERSISFCKLRTRLRSPACDAVKIRCLSRRTSSSTDRQSIDSQSQGPSSGPFIVPTTGGAACVVSLVVPATVSNLSLGSSALKSAVRHRPTRPTSAPVRVRAGARIRPVIRDDRRRGRSRCPAFPLPFGHRHLLLGSSYSRRGVPRRSRTSCDWGGRPLYPGNSGVLRLLVASRSRRLPPLNGRFLHPGTTTHPAGLYLTRHHQGFTRVRPSSLPLRLWRSDGAGALGLDPLSFAPRGYPRRTSGWGRTLDTGPELHPRHRSSSRRVHSQRAPSRRTAHRALQPQQQPVVEVGQLVNAVSIDHQRVDEPSQLQQAGQVGRRAGQARHLQAENGADLAQAHPPHQLLVTRAVLG